MTVKTPFQLAVLAAADETDPDARRIKIMVVENWPTDEIEAELVPAERSNDNRTEFAFCKRSCAYSHLQNKQDWNTPYPQWVERLVNWMTDPANRKETYPNG
jgi:hypothetical protein